MGNVYGEGGITHNNSGLWLKFRGFFRQSPSGLSKMQKNAGNVLFAVCSSHCTDWGLTDFFEQIALIMMKISLVAVILADCGGGLTLTMGN